MCMLLPERINTVCVCFVRDGHILTIYIIMAAICELVECNNHACDSDLHVTIVTLLLKFWPFWLYQLFHTAAAD